MEQRNSSVRAAVRGGSLSAADFAQTAAAAPVGGEAAAAVCAGTAFGSGAWAVSRSTGTEPGRNRVGQCFGGLVTTQSEFRK